MHLQAIAKFGGTKMRSVANLFARIDVVMPAYGASQAGDIESGSTTSKFVPMINEVNETSLLCLPVYC